LTVLGCAAPWLCIAAWGRDTRDTRDAGDWIVPAEKLAGGVTVISPRAEAWILVAELKLD
jgi:hypothetical protein